MYDYFVAHDGKFTCGDCNSRSKRFDIARSDVEVWRLYSHGWLGPVVCCECRLSLPVYLVPLKVRLTKTQWWALSLAAEGNLRSMEEEVAPRLRKTRDSLRRRGLIDRRCRLTSEGIEALDQRDEKAA